MNHNNCWHCKNSASMDTLMCKRTKQPTEPDDAKHCIHFSDARKVVTPIAGQNAELRRK